MELTWRYVEGDNLTARSWTLLANGNATVFKIVWLPSTHGQPEYHLHRIIMLNYNQNPGDPDSTVKIESGRTLNSVKRLAIHHHNLLTAKA